MKYVFVSDTHGRYDKLAEALAEIKMGWNTGF